MLGSLVTPPLASARNNRFVGTRVMMAMLALGLSACASVPAGLTPVADFEVERYLGRWYEIARLDHRFERGLSEVTAEYRLRDDGRISVVNRGWQAERQRWRQAAGRARFIGARDVAHLGVSFFGPFYSSYVVFELDADYRHALVAGSRRCCLWILAREPLLPEATRRQLEERLREAGFDPATLIWVEHGRVEAPPRP
jgi:apolipoprotein D and lipocalin family protein